MLATTAPCHGGLAVMEILAMHFGKPFHVLQIPSGSDEDAVERLARRLEDSVEFISSVTGQRPTPEKIAQAIEASNRARALWKEVNELAAAVPTPQRPRDLINFGIVMNLFLGTEAAVEVARTYRDEFAKRVERGEGGHPAERVRLMWLQNRIQFRSGLDEALAQMGAAVVLDELNHVFWDDIDPNRPYHGLARRMLSLPLCQSAQERARTLVELAKLYRVQGAINPCHWGCRQGSGSRGIIQKFLREAGIPVINLEVDCVDERNFSEGQLRTRLEAFCEMLEGR
ncbi:MAG: 2-hydroxyacyl-CoA dehydratase [Deltaproteobacteria bacterium]|nr:MAG: 2-hydroxyacyl-CoA dehydratase [Deltaproteobacteria bacterium]